MFLKFVALFFVTLLRRRDPFVSHFKNVTHCICNTTNKTPYVISSLNFPDFPE